MHIQRAIPIFGPFVLFVSPLFNEISWNLERDGETTSSLLASGGVLQRTAAAVFQLTYKKLFILHPLMIYPPATACKSRL